MATLWNSLSKIDLKKMNNTFMKDVDNGLSANPKILSSKYFYDAIGDALFIKIMQMPEYYLTNSEFEILSQQTETIVNNLGLTKNKPFDLVELGAGDGKKTKELLRYLIKHDYNFNYVPIDISSNVLNLLENSLRAEFKTLNIAKKQGDYFEVLKEIKANKKPKVVLFLGSNMGNMEDEKAQVFIETLSDALEINDKLLVGLDLIKSEAIVLPAYNDQAGITKAFNLNLLSRINKELLADFNIETFDHRAIYSEQTGIARSYIVSKVEQTVSIARLNKTFNFKKEEAINVEISRKYNDAIVDKLIVNSGFKRLKKLTDSKQFFANYIFNKSAS